MKLKLKTLELKRFIGAGSSIRSKGILPILDYVKIDCDKIIKTNMEVYLEMSITPVVGTLLIDENILNALVKNTTADEITVEVKGTKVTLSDGKSKPYFTLPDDASVFPNFPESEKENEVKLTEDVLKAISAAAKNIANVGGGATFDFVHLAYNYVFGSDQFRFYFKKFESLPTLSMSGLAASIISQYGGANYYRRENYDFYEIGSLLYGFSQQEVAVPKFIDFIPFTSKDTYMEVDVSDLLGFLEFLSSSTSTLTVTCDFKGNKLSFFDADLSAGNDIELEVEGNYKLNKSFLPRLLIPLLKSIGSDKIRFSPMKGDRKGVTLWVDGDESLLAMLGEASVQN